MVALSASAAQVAVPLATLEARMGPPIHVEILAYTCDTLPGWVRNHFATASCPMRIVNVRGAENMATVPQDVHISELAQGTTGQTWTLTCTDCAILGPGTGPYTAFVSRSGLQLTILYSLVGDKTTYSEVFNVWPPIQGGAVCSHAWHGPSCIANSARSPSHGVAPETWLIGTWNCESAAGSHGVKVFSSASVDTILVHKQYSMPDGSQFHGTEYLTYDARSAQWTMSVPSDGFWPSFVVHAGPWAGTSWEFVGPTRHVIYTFLSEDAFRLDWERYQGDSWASYSTDTCTRIASAR